MPDPFTPAELDLLSAEIDLQLRALHGQGAALKRGDLRTEALVHADSAAAAPGEAQLRAIAQATGEDAASFLARFRAAAHDDICKPGGILHTQWTKWKDLASKDALKTVGGVLVAMGLAGSALQIVAVAITVYILMLGLDAYCRKP